MYRFELFGIKFSGLGFVVVALSLGSLIGRIAKLLVDALVFALVAALLLEVEERLTGEEEEGDGDNGDGDGDDDGDNGDGDGEGTGYMDPGNGGGDDRLLWDVARPSPAPALTGRAAARPTTRAPRTARDSDQSASPEVGFAAVLAPPGVPVATQRSGSTGYATTMTRSGR